MAKHISNLKIEQDYITIFASGNSLLELSQEDVEFIYSKTFLITMNYGPINFPCHMNIWSDKLVTDFMIEHFKTNPKDHITLARFQAFDHKNVSHGDLYNSIDYTYDNKRDGITGCYTIVFLLQILQKYFPTKTILIFGLDGKIEYSDDSNAPKKWYDKFTIWDSKVRNKSVNYNNKIQESCVQMKENTKNNNIINCNMNSYFDYYNKKDYKEILK